MIGTVLLAAGVVVIALVVVLVVADTLDTCSHVWVEIDRAYQKPAYGLKLKAEWVDEDVLERALHGFTVVELRCSVCGLLTHDTTPGRIPLPKGGEG